MQLFKDNNGQLKTKAIFWTAVCIVIIVCVAYFLVFYFVVHVNMEKRGQFGDMFGFIGALFSGLAFAGLIVTMLQQREDLQNQKDEIRLQRQDLEAQTEALKLQKEEIAQTNEELKLQRKEMKEQNKTMMLQRFENTFFNMIHSQIDICNNVKVNDISGKDAIERIFIISEKKTGEYNLIDSYMKHHLDHYFRHLTQTLKVIDSTSFLSDQEKYYYSEILSSHMSVYELASFFYYCLSDEGKTKAKVLVENCALFKRLKDERSFPQEMLELFTDGAYSQIYRE